MLYNWVLFLVCRFMSELFPSSLSVSELNAMAKNMLESHFSGLWISGEVSNLTRAASGHYYFSLKDHQAQVRCAMFKHAAARLSSPLQEGIQIEVCGKITLYEARGEFQINVMEARLAGWGQLYARYEQLKKQLQDEGLFASENKKKLPENPKIIGIVTSLAAAALRDVLTTLSRRSPDIPIIVYPTAVQGVGSDKQISHAISMAAQRQEVDVLIVCRGGGSIEDLWSFNEESVVRAIAACPIPVVSGVGHETDFTLSDFVADVRAATPTAAAELVSPNRIERLVQVSRMAFSLQQSLLRYYQNASQKVDWLSHALQHPAQRIQEQKNHLLVQQQKLHHLFNQTIEYKLQSLSNQHRLLHSYRPSLAMYQKNLAWTKTGLIQQWQHYLNDKKIKINQLSSLLEAISPQQVLNRGFSVVRTQQGQIVRQADSLKQGQKLHIVFADGERDVRVLSPSQQADLFD